MLTKIAKSILMTSKTGCFY